MIYVFPCTEHELCVMAQTFIHVMVDRHCAIPPCKRFLFHSSVENVFLDTVLPHVLSLDSILDNR